MKRISIILAAAAFLPLSLGAQNMYDAMEFSANNYYGTARTMALGNAVTAVGGDLGTIGINPAGSAVSGYGQFTVSPGLSISSVGSAFSPVGETQYGSPVQTSRTKFTLPNIGLSINMQTGSGSGLKSVTFAVVSNRTQSFNYGYTAYGTNSSTSAFAELASAAYGCSSSDLDDYNSYYDSSASWDVITGYRSNLFSGLGGNQYAGNSEFVPEGNRYHYVPGDLSQQREVRRWGSKNDLIMNMGFNFNDNFFVGVNIGLPSATYSYGEYYTEAAVNPDKFQTTFSQADGSTLTTNWCSGSTDYVYEAKISGIYAKAGFIWLPTSSLRVGAAIQSPTAMTITETWNYVAESVFSDNRVGGSAESPWGDYTYCLRTPYIIDAGLAYTIGPWGFVSVDYELSDYSVMRFSDVYSDSHSHDTFLDLNEVNGLFCGLQHSVRVGAEARLTPAFSLRAGYSMTTCPERHYTDNTGADVNADVYLADFDSYHSKVKTLGSAQYYPDRSSSVSLGFGYSSSGSFFADFALRCNLLPDQVDMAYYDYDNYNAAGVLVNALSPRIYNTRKLWDATLTFGWRF